jgi:hypothetical protein
LIGDKYQPLVNNIIKELGPDKISDLLLSYYLYFLTNIHFANNQYLQGFATLKVFNEFGKFIFNKFNCSRYIISNLYKQGQSYSQYIEKIHKNWLSYAHKKVYPLYLSFNIFSKQFL